MEHTIDDIVRAIKKGPDNERFCQLCGENYYLRNECESTALCNSCAQEASEKLAEELLRVQLANDGEWSTLMADITDYYKDERADRSRGRATLVITLLGGIRIERDNLIKTQALSNLKMLECVETIEKLKATISQLTTEARSCNGTTGAGGGSPSPEIAEPVPTAPANGFTSPEALFILCRKGEAPAPRNHAP